MEKNENISLFLTIGSVMKGIFSELSMTLTTSVTMIRIIVSNWQKVQSLLVEMILFLEVDTN